MPSPNVDSAVIRIDINRNYRLEPDSEKFFFRVVKAGFSQRRKTLANAVSSQIGVQKEKIYTILRETGLSESVRTESMSMEQLIEFSEKLRNVM